MAFRHGVYKSEVPTSLISPSQGEAGLPVVVGCSPVFMGDSGNVNKPVLCYSYSEAVQALGFMKQNWEDWTLCEFIYSQFALFGQAPCVLINVFDPAKHKESVTAEEHEVVDKEVNLGVNVILSAGLTFTDDEGEAIELDHEGNYDDAGNAIITFTGSSVPSSVKVSYVKAKPEMVTAEDIIGGVNAQTGEYKGLELVNQIFPKFRLIPGLIAAPKWSGNSAVAAVMRAKSENINGLFTCMSVIDIPCDSVNGVPSYSAVPEWKNQNNYMSERQIVCWPKVKLGDDVYHMSTQIVGLINSVDSNHDDVPYKSPSNELLQMDSCVNDAGQEISLGLEEANYLNGQGITTALNFMSGWVAWGNRTGAYPANTDPKDSFIPIRRMFDFIGNTFITTFWQKTDEPMTPRLIRTIVDSFNVYMNGLTAREMILGGRIEFLESENPVTDLQDGTVKFHIYITPPPPAEVIQGILEFDPSYFETLFSALG